MPGFLFLLMVVGVTRATMYLPPMKEDHLLTNMLQEIIDRMDMELSETADSYLQYADGPRHPEDYDKAKEIPIELPPYYEGVDTLNPNPSTRDQEYLQHSTLCSDQRVNNNDKINDRHRIQAAGLKAMKDEKSENALPAYCTPPNPCPIGYTSEHLCIEAFENTAAFSRDYQSAQDCMCDTEHMLDCSNDSVNDNTLPGMHISKSDLDQIVEEFQDENPYFQGEKLPIAAKKGINVIY